MKTEKLLYDWNAQALPARPFSVLDETLRDGIQSPSVKNPELDKKIEILHAMEACSIDFANLGLPGAGATAAAEVTRLVEEIRDQHLRLRPNCAARTHPGDLQAVADIAQKTGCLLEVCAFLGCSTMRRLLENWDLKELEEKVAQSISFSVGQGLETTFVTEDTSRTDPKTLKRLFRVALDQGATRLILTDTVGYATPSGLASLVRYVRGLLRDWNYTDISLDWHGHNDRGLALALCLTALDEGVDRIHGTCLGLGERVGNAPLDLLLVNLRLLNLRPPGLAAVRHYVERVSTYYEVPIPVNYPAFGRDAFRTATGVHAAAIAKARRLGDERMADQIYSSVPASELGLQQQIDIGYYSGRANVVAWLQQHNLEPQESGIRAILELAKNCRATLTKAEILNCLNYS
ncbi:2-isopropylmalate synthase [bacterium]|nr:2-isopropylmalate synthase [bacterium]